MPSINRQLLLLITLAFGLALVLPLACGGLGSFSNSQQSNSVGNRDGGNNSDDEDDNDDCDDEDHHRDGGRPDSGVCHRENDDENECDEEGHHRDGGSNDDGRHVTICHFPPGNPGNAHTIRVGAPAVRAHMAHGDHLGACGPGEGHCGRDGGQPDGGHDGGGP
jgi:hypothetical protein